MFPDERPYYALNPAEKAVADAVTHFCYDILDALEQTITAKLDPQELRYSGDPLEFARWVIEFELPSGKPGGVSFTIKCDHVNQPNYKHSIFREIVNQYADRVYRQGSETEGADDGEV